jgi:hypothetical protein
MEFTNTEEVERLKSIIYKLTRDKELSEQEKEIIDKIVEEKDYTLRD